jgi:PLP dependent protein
MTSISSSSSTHAFDNRVAANLHNVRARLEHAARHAGRDPRDIRLIAVSKTLPAGAVAAAVHAGQLEFGENTIQDALRKIPALAEYKLTWHFIGHLQMNKVKFVPGHFAWVHSLDRLVLAQKLSQACEHAGTVVNALVQVNVTGDAHKHGVDPDGTYALVEQILETPLPGLRLHGLMTLGPFQASDDVLHECFAKLRVLRERCAERFGRERFTELSMGMTNDFSIAIAEGATLVRIGTAIFGPRPKT